MVVKYHSLLISCDKVNRGKITLCSPIFFTTSSVCNTRSITTNENSICIPKSDDQANFKPLLFLYIQTMFLLSEGGTVRKRRDPAILDREELFLQLEIEEIFFSGEFCNPISKIIPKLANTNRCATNKQHQDFIAYHS